jgi:hypothetical protein
MATTTNFGWETPDDTDLVKDGAAAIRTALGGVDTSFVDLKGGTTGQVLAKASATDLDFAFVTPAYGKILQVVTASTTTSTAIASETYTDTTLTASITPSAATSRILIMTSQNFFSSRSSDTWNGAVRLLRDSTTILTVGPGGYEAFGNFVSSASGGGQLRGMNALCHIDSPSTTSAVTYKTQGRAAASSNSGQVTFQSNSAPSTIILMEIGA